MRRLTAVLPVVMASAPASAHTPGAEDTVVDTLVHHLLAAHHFPGMAMLSMVLLLCIAGLVVKHARQSRR